MTDPKIRQTLYQEAANYGSLDAYASDLALSSLWGDAPDETVPPERVELLETIYDAAHATIPGLLRTYGLSQSSFARYFNIPLRTVQDWCSGRRVCPPYVVAMAAEILAKDE